MPKRRLPDLEEARAILAAKRSRPPYRAARPLGASLGPYLKGMESRFGAGPLLKARWREIAGEILSRRTEQPERPAPKPATPTTPQRTATVLRPAAPPRALADRAASRPPPRPCRHCQGSHWDSECPKASRPSRPFGTAAAPAVAAHFVDVPSAPTEQEYAELEYRHLEALHSASGGDADDMPELSFSSADTGDESTSSA